MNKAYKVVWNESLGTWCAISENSKTRGKRSSGKAVVASTLLTVSVLTMSGVTFAADNYVSVNDGGVQSGNYNNDGAIASGSVVIGPDSSSVGSSGVAIGNNADVSGLQGVAIGQNAQAGYQSMALGHDAVATAFNSMALGGNSIAYTDGTALGQGTYANKLATAMGNGSLAVGQESTAYGYSALAGTDSFSQPSAGTDPDTIGKAYATAMGSRAKASAQGSTALGAGSVAEVESGVALGSSSVANTAAGVAGYIPTGANQAQSSAINATQSTLGAVSIGSTGNTRQITNVAAGTIDTDAVNVAQLKAAQAATETHYVGINDGGTQGANYNNDGATGKNALAVGIGANASGERSVAVGFNNTAIGNISNVFGSGNTAEAEYSSIVGYTNNVKGSAVLAVGGDNTVNGTHTAVVGTYNNIVGTESQALGNSNTITQGYSAVVGRSNTADGYHSAILGGDNVISNGFRSTAVGSQNKVVGQSSTAVGHANSVNADAGSALGYANNVAASSVAIGLENNVTATASGALGGKNTVNNKNTFAIGNSITTTQDNSIVLGNESSDRAASTVDKVTINGKDYTVAGAGSTLKGIVSVGKAGGERQIINVAAGDVSATSTDAVNGSQLFVTNKAIADNQTHYVSVNDEGVQSGNYNNDGAQGKNSLVVGMNSTTTVNATNNVSVGLGNYSQADNAIAVGSNNYIDINNAVALGINNNVQLFGGSTAVGIGNSSYGRENTIVGNNNKTLGSYHQVFGTKNNVINGSYQSILGYGNTIGGADYNIVIGTNNNIATTYYPSGDGGRAIALGHNNNVEGIRSGSVGQDAMIKGNGSFSFGNGNKVTNNESTALGLSNNISGTGVYALGANNIVAQNNTFVIGNSVATTQDNSVVLGNESSDRAATSVDKVTINGEDYTVAGAGSVTNGIVSVGKAGAERQIINVAAGEVSATSTDAVNGSQLFATNKAIADSQTHYVSINDGGTQGNNYNNDGAKGTNSLAIGIDATVVSGGNDSIAIGSGAQAAAGRAVVIGLNAGSGNVSDGDANVLIGMNAGQNNDGRWNTAVGSNSGYNTKGERNTALGDYSGRDVTGSGNIGLGGSAGNSVTGETNLAVGASAGGTVMGSHNTALGRTSGVDVVGDSNTASGLDSGSVVRGSANSAYGQGSGRNITGDRNTAIGVSSGSNISGDYNAALAYGAGNNSIGNLNTALGFTAGQDVKGDANSAVGDSAGQRVTGNYNTAQGSTAGRDVFGIQNTAVGTSAGSNVGTSTQPSSYNSAFGINAGRNIQGDSNLALGDTAGNNVTGSRNVALGRAAGQDLNNIDDATSLGSGSKAAVSNSVALGANSQAIRNVGNETVYIPVGTTIVGANAAGGEVSIGAIGRERRITNVAAASQDTDAVNLSQLKAAQAAATSHYVSINDDGIQGGNYNNDGASGKNSLAVGVGAKAAGENAIAIGNVSTDAAHSIAIGNNNVLSSSAIASTVIGSNNNVMGNEAVALGSNNSVKDFSGVAVGSYNQAQGYRSIAIGAENRTNGQWSSAFGVWNTADGERSTVLGANNTIQGRRALGVGVANEISSTSEYSSAIGAFNKITDNTKSLTAGNSNVVAGGEKNSVLGNENQLNNAKNTTVLGNKNIVAQENTQVLGNNVTTSQANSVVLGTDSTDRAATTVDKVTINDEDYTFAGIGSASNGVISVGKVGGERQIINVAAGEVSASSTDAINGSQLYATNQAVDKLAAGQTHYVSINDNGNQEKNYNNDGATGKNAIAVGLNSNAAGQFAVAMGSNTYASKNYALALGTAAMVSVDDGVALGSNSRAETQAGVAGYDPLTGKTTSNKSETWLSTLGAVSVGDAQNGLTRQINAVAAGTADTDAVNVAQLKAAQAAATSHYVSINDSGNQKANYNNDGATGLNSLAIGTSSLAAGTSAVALGDISNASGNFGIAIGYGARALGQDSYVLGKGSEVSGAASTTLGAGNGITGNFSTAVGAANRVDQDKTVVLGNFVNTTQANSVVLGHESTDRAATSESKVNINGQDYAFAGVGSASNGVVSVGKVGGERQIINVAAGKVSSDSTDAVNGSQLYATNQAISEVGKSAAVAKTEVVQGDNIVVTETQGKNGQSIYNVATAKEVSFDKTTVGTVITDSTTGKITGLTAGEVSANSTDAINGSQLYATNKAIADSKTHYVSVNDDGVQADNYNNDGATGKNALAVGVGSKATGENAVVIGYNNNVVQDKTVALGSSITTTQANSVVLGHESTDRAATSESKVTILGQDYAFAGVGSVANGVVSVGKVGGERQIINVAAGQLSATSTDAVNGSQLYATNQAISSLQGQVSGAKSTVTEGKNTTVTKTTNADGSTDYQVATKDDVSFDSVTVGNIKADAQSNKISGLADGEVSATSNDAVNGSQLHGTAESVANVLGGNAKINADGTVSTSNIGNTGKDNVHDAIASLQGQVAGSKTSVSAGKNTVVNSSTNADGSNNYQVALADDINLNSVTANQVTANQVKADQVIANQVMANQVNVGKVTIDGTSNKVSGLANGTISKDSTDAINGSQLHQTNSNVAQYLGGGSTLNQDGSIKAPTYNVAGGTYHNVGDALGAVDTRVSNLEQAFYNTNKNVDDLRNDTYAGIAGAMAVGNLPQPTEAGMSMMSAGLSGYRGETAVAVGISAITDSNKIIWKMGASADSRSNIGGAVSVGYQWK